jgi:hypothetical protein
MLVLLTRDEESTVLEGGRATGNGDEGDNDVASELLLESVRERAEDERVAELRGVTESLDEDDGIVSKCS